MSSPPTPPSTRAHTENGRKNNRAHGPRRHEPKAPSTTSTQVSRIDPTTTPFTTNGGSDDVHANGSSHRRRHEAKPAEDPYPALRALLRLTQDQLANVTSELDTCKRSLHLQTINNSADRHALEETRRDLKHANQAIAERDRELAHVQRQKKDVEELLERRTAELNAAQAFFPSSETVTDTQVADLVKNLNYEIAQVAIALVESYEDKPRVVPPGAAVKFCTQRLQAAMGDAVIRRLTPTQGGKGDVDFMTSFQIGLQSCITWVVQWVAVQWHLGPQKKLGIFDEVWDSLHRSEPAPIAIKWSTLTRKYARKALDWKRVDEYISNRIAQHVADVVVLSGYESTAKDREIATSLILSKVERQITEVARLAIQLNETIGQKFPTYTVEPLLFGAGTSFDPSTMASEFNDGDGVQEDAVEKVICTTELGLRRATEGGSAHQILVKSKVVLDTRARR